MAVGHSHFSVTLADVGLHKRVAETVFWGHFHGASVPESGECGRETSGIGLSAKLAPAKAVQGHRTPKPGGVRETLAHRVSVLECAAPAALSPSQSGSWSLGAGI